MMNNSNVNTNWIHKEEVNIIESGGNANRPTAEKICRKGVENVISLNTRWPRYVLATCEERPTIAFLEILGSVVNILKPNRLLPLHKDDLILEMPALIEDAKTIENNRSDDRGLRNTKAKPAIRKNE